MDVFEVPEDQSGKELPSSPTMSSHVDLSQFGQWLVEHQGNLVKDL